MKKLKSRDLLIGTIERVVKRLKAQATHTVVEMHPLFHRNETTVFRATSLWVFGSFARGAPECGDLDLLISVELVSGVWCSQSRTIRAALGNVPGVDVLCDHDGNMLQQFPEAKLLWSPEQAELDKNLAAIPVDPHAKRFERKTDCLPVSLKQLRSSREEAETLADDIQAGIFTSRWVPLDTIQINREKWPADLVRMEGIWSSDSGKDTRKLIPYFVQYCIDRCEAPSRRNHLRERGCLQINGLFIYMGRPALCDHRLERADTNAVILAPHISRHYPSGFWILERGDNHPSVQAFSNLSAWVEGDHNGGPVHFTALVDRYTEYETVELFPTREAIAERIRDSQDSEDPQEQGSHVPVQLSGRALLEACCNVEALDVCNYEYESDERTNPDDYAGGYSDHARDHFPGLLLTCRVDANSLAKRLHALNGSATKD